MRVAMHAGFDTHSAWGNDAIQIALTLTQMGVDVVPFPMGISPGLPKMFTDLFTKDGRGDYDIGLTVGLPHQMDPSVLGPSARANVGWSSSDWLPLRPVDMRKGNWDSAGTRTRWWGSPDGAENIPSREKDWFDLMLVTAPEMIAGYANLDSSVPYGLCPFGVETEMFPEREYGTAGKMRFLSVGNGNGRQQPLVTLAGWRRAREMDPEFDAQLVLASSIENYGERFSPADGVTFGAVGSTDPFSREALFNSSDVLISTSTGEGVGRDALEFMSTGGVVTGSDHLAYKNFMFSDNAVVIPSMVSLDYFGRQSAVYEIDSVAEAFLTCWRERSKLKMKGRLAAKIARQGFSWETVCKRMIQLSSEVM